MAIKELVPISQMIEVLNRALKVDPEAIQLLYEYRVPVNQELADDPTIQVREGSPCTLSILGLINGLIGSDSERWGTVCAVFDDETGRILRFEDLGRR